MLARHNLVRHEHCALSYSPDDDLNEEQSKAGVQPVRPVAVRTYSANSALRSARKQHFRQETGGQVPERHIHFNESVEQCISIIKPDPDDGYDSSSSDDAPTMRISAPKPPINIAKLPSTTLKLPCPTILANGAQMTTGETEYSALDLATSDLVTTSSPCGTDIYYNARTNRPNLPEASMLPNYDGLQDESPPPGIFGRAAEVVSSARDLVSVIWSASGWRRPENGP